MKAKLYADHENGNTYIVSQDIERDAKQAKMTVKQYIKELKKLNPQLVKVYMIQAVKKKKGKYSMKAADYIRKFVSENEDKYEIYEGYSGRGMFGRTCLGIIVRNGNSPMELMMNLTCYLNENTSDDKDFDLGAFEGMSTDNLGKDSIVYFPSIQGQLIWWLIK